MSDTLLRRLLLAAALLCCAAACAGPREAGLGATPAVADPRLSADMGELARAYVLLGRHDLARPLYERLVRLDEALDGEGPRLADDLCGLGLVEAAQGRAREAAAAYGRALEVLDRAGAGGGLEAARCLTNLAVLRWREGAPREAARLQARALAAAERSPGVGGPRLASLRQNLALMGAGPAAAGDGFAVQVASVRDPAAAPAEWRRLAGRHRSLADLGPRRPRPVDVPGRGRFYRVLGGAFATRAVAEAACGPVRAGGRDCWVVATDLLETA
jgi:tetratricopeptide (TPR) repeat protein